MKHELRSKICDMNTIMNNCQFIAKTASYEILRKKCPNFLFFFLYFQV